MTADKEIISTTSAREEKSSNGDQKHGVMKTIHSKIFNVKYESKGDYDLNRLGRDTLSSPDSLTLHSFNGSCASGSCHNVVVKIRRASSKVGRKVVAAAKFIGPGMMVAVAYMDPGNYSTDVAAGAQKQYALLFVVLLSNLLAIFLQSLAIKLGAVTGHDLAVNCRVHLPKWVGYALYVFAEVAIIATDIAEVIGTAIALNILFNIPLMAGVILTIVDVLIVLLAYRPGNGMLTVRIFELGVMILLFGVVICFAVELSRIPPVNVGHVLRGYIPSSDVINGGGLYLSCGILGATVMPHSLYLGSALIKPRVHEYDVAHGNVTEDMSAADMEEKYQPTFMAIKSILNKSIIELAISLCTVAIFVNSAILIVSGATMFDNSSVVDADLYGIYRILGEILSKSAATLFMVALLCSGQSAGIVCTIAGQIVSEGHIKWKFRPWLRRIITRAIAIVPCVVVVAAVGKSGLNATLNASQVALSILLPFLTAPLIYLTSKKEVMSVTVHRDRPVIDVEEPQVGYSVVDMSNGILCKILGFSVWLFIAILNVYLIVLLGLSSRH
ncbi:divalent metal ion transporter SMF1 [Sugiyamaella lignohabitans]|uniref:Divalent metal ion transporter SMF1 n=1 Tax=Sugiyamaella lignohabitans TaxID=796027 RepID=A0A167FHE7_9ASCO|nr:divalent metal ion transporter SMF1 [Sugiyamaella lignohabitans]ANB15302.1 divalent metal ion transporter SMF1 [Sugiyamaella lignohabitans]